MINLNFNTDDNQINDFIVVCEKFNQRPHRLVIHETYKAKETLNYFEKKIENVDYQVNFHELIPSHEDYIHNQRTLKQINDAVFVSYLEIDVKNDDSTISEIIFYYRDLDNSEEIQDYIQDLQEFIYEDDSLRDDITKTNILSIRDQVLTNQPVEFPIQENIELYYNNKTFTQYKKLAKKINKSDRGLSIIWGDYGCGKSNLLKHLSTLVNHNCIYIPLNLFDQSINNPDFRNFLKNDENYVLIIDDCEFLLNPIFSKNNYFSQNLLQLVDGIFSETLKVQVVLTFNIESEEEIDPILLDSNRLIDILEISELSPEKATELSDFLEHNKKYKCSTRVVNVVRDKKGRSNNLIGLD